MSWWSKLFRREKPVNTVLRVLSDNRRDYSDIPRQQGTERWRDIYRTSVFASTGVAQQNANKMLFALNLDAADIRKAAGRGDKLYYIPGESFVLNFPEKDGSTQRLTVRFDLSGLAQTESTKLAEWLDYVWEEKKNEDRDFDAEAVSKLLQARYKSDGLEGLKGIVRVEECRREEAPKRRLSDYAVGEMVLGHYTLGEKIAQGGQGVAYRATEVNTNAAVVMKSLAQYDDKESLQEEANRLRKLNYPAIVGFRGLEALNGNPVLITQYVEGETLASYLTKRELSGQSVSEDEAQEILNPIAAALDYAHQRNIYHLDVDPSNIIVCPEGSDPRAVLIDFGVAREDKAENDRISMARGKSPYMAPEYSLCQSPSAAMDVFSLAATAYRCLAGKDAYPDGCYGGADEYLEQLDSVSPFAQAIMKSLDFKAENRLESCGALVNPSQEELNPAKTSVAYLYESLKEFRVILRNCENAAEEQNKKRWIEGRRIALRKLMPDDPAKVNRKALEKYFEEFRRHTTEQAGGTVEFLEAGGQGASLANLRMGLSGSKDLERIGKAFLSALR